MDPQYEAVKNPRTAKWPSADRPSKPRPSHESEQDSTSVKSRLTRSTAISRSTKGSKRSKQSITSSTVKGVSHTGLKHMICNKIRLCGQKRYFDANPCVIIVPILTMKQARDWLRCSFHHVQRRGDNRRSPTTEQQREKDTSTITGCDGECWPAAFRCCIKRIRNWELI